MSQDALTSPQKDNILNELVSTVRRIELRIVGDPDLQSIGLVQELFNFKNEYREDRKEVATILEKITDKLAELERDRAAQLLLNDDFKKQPKLIEKTLWKYGAISIGTVSVLGGTVAWLQTTHFFDRMFHG